MKNDHFLQICVSLLVLLFFSCDDNGQVKYIQFTSDDLTHLYYDKDTLTFVGEDIYYQDSVCFLLNATDTIFVAVKTNIYSEKPMWEFRNQENIFGSSEIRFEKQTGFFYADISINRSNDRGTSEKWFQVGLINSNYSGFSEMIYQKDTLYALDTAWVLGKLYNDVYKFQVQDENDNSHIKTVYFAKKYGYIKIVSTDGKKLELIGIKSKDSTNLRRH